MEEVIGPRDGILGIGPDAMPIPSASRGVGIGVDSRQELLLSSYVDGDEDFPNSSLIAVVIRI